MPWPHFFLFKAAKVGEKPQKPQPFTDPLGILHRSRKSSCRDFVNLYRFLKNTPERLRPYQFEGCGGDQASAPRASRLPSLLCTTSTSSMATRVVHASLRAQTWTPG